MARPRTIKLDNGEISLKGFEKELGDKLVEHIKSFGKPSVEPLSSQQESPQEAPSQPLKPTTTVKKHRALAWHLNEKTKKYDVVTVGYNDEDATKVDSVEFRRDAITKFKQVATELNLV